MRKLRNNFITRLRHHVEFLEQSSASALEDEQWQCRLACAVEIVPICGMKPHIVEDFGFGHLVTEKLFVIHARFHPEIHDKMRIYYERRVFTIKRVINVNERSRYLYIIAQEE